MPSIFYHCLENQLSRLTLLPNNVGKNSANDVGPQQGHNTGFQIKRGFPLSFLSCDLLIAVSVQFISSLLLHISYQDIFRNNIHCYLLKSHQLCKNNGLCLCIIFFAHFDIGLEGMLGKNPPFKACSDVDSASNTQNQYMQIVYNQEKLNWIFACPVPCKQIGYAAHPTYFHRSSLLNLREDDFKSLVLLTIRYETLAIEENVESLVYDVANFLAAVGGNLGLFLGFSCLSVFLSLLNFLMTINIKELSQ